MKLEGEWNRARDRPSLCCRWCDSPCSLGSHRNNSEADRCFHSFPVGPRRRCDWYEEYARCSFCDWIVAHTCLVIGLLSRPFSYLPVKHWGMAEKLRGQYLSIIWQAKECKRSTATNLSTNRQTWWEPPEPRRHSYPQLSPKQPSSEWPRTHHLFPALTCQGYLPMYPRSYAKPRSLSSWQQRTQVFLSLLLIQAWLRPITSTELVALLTSSPWTPVSLL